MVVVLCMAVAGHAWTRRPAPFIGPDPCHLSVSTLASAQSVQQRWKLPPNRCRERCAVWAEIRAGKKTGPEGPLQCTFEGARRRQARKPFPVPLFIGQCQGRLDAAVVSG